MAIQVGSEVRIKDGRPAERVPPFLQGELGYVTAGPLVIRGATTFSVAVENSMPGAKRCAAVIQFVQNDLEEVV